MIFYFKIYDISLNHNTVNSLYQRLHPVCNCMYIHLFFTEKNIVRNEHTRLQMLHVINELAVAPTPRGFQTAGICILTLNSLPYLLPHVQLKIVNRPTYMFCLVVQ